MKMNNRTKQLSLSLTLVTVLSVIQCIDGGCVHTYGGSVVNGSQCVFPFTYRGKFLLIFAMANQVDCQ